MLTQQYSAWYAVYHKNRLNVSPYKGAIVNHSRCFPRPFTFYITVYAPMALIAIHNIVVLFLVANSINPRQQGGQEGMFSLFCVL